ncbi:MAG: hypothetical protein QOI38_1980 [Sphingomonadales bacterium]|jgi:hypothetical protein|nr:hypothetical protein [Sphingomonadales bacterium]
MVDTWGAERGLKRFEGFTDAVFAIALHLAAVALALVAPRAGVALASLILLYFLMPQPKPRCRPGMEPDEEETAEA